MTNEKFKEVFRRQLAELREQHARMKAAELKDLQICQHCLNERRCSRIPVAEYPSSLARSFASPHGSDFSLEPPRFSELELCEGCERVFRAEAGSRYYTGGNPQEVQLCDVLEATEVLA